MPERSTPPRGFSTQEYESRTSKAQALMADSGIAALLLTTEPEILYFTGFITEFWQSPTRPWFVIVPAQGKPIAVIPQVGAELMGRGWLEDIRTWPAPVPEDDGVSLVTGALGECAGDNGKIGVPTGPETHLRMPLADFQRLQNNLPGSSFIDATHIIRTLRMVKSEAEIAKIGHICGIVSDAFAALPGLIRTGNTEVEIFREFRLEILSRGADSVPFLVGSAEPGGYADIISPANDRSTEAGDVMILDNGSVFDGYFCDFDRNFGFGNVDDAAKRAYETCYRATDAGMAAARPGNTTTDVFHAIWRELEAGGAIGNDVGRQGHGLGMQLTEWPSNNATDMTVLKEGMVITIEPAMAFAPGKLMVHEENIVVRDGEPQLLTTRAASELPII